MTQKRQETPGERADRLGSEGYQLRRTQEPGVYFVRKPDGSREYRVDMNDRRCNCQATVVCKHILYCDWFWDRDRAAADLAEARRRGVGIAEAESATWAAEWHLRRIVGRAAERKVAA